MPDDPHDGSRPRPSLDAIISNWDRSDAPFLAKLRMAAANNCRKLRLLQDCCGNDGQPGC
ncbi:MAG: hypothetical protein ACYDEB_06120 [Dehalococcoidia bacterium]